jgi:hypothetical protein
MSILAYIVRHGFTDTSPKPEWWSQVPLNALGRAQAADAAEFLKGQNVKPDFGISSDLQRAEDTLAICAEILGIKCMRPVADLRALNKDEDQKEFEKRNLHGFTAILAAAKLKGKVPLIACHRSNTAWLAKHFSNVRQEIDYRAASLVWEGGVVCIKNGIAIPIYKRLAQNAKEDLAQPYDGTHISGFVTASDNKPPRECGNCKWMEGSACHHPVVTADDELTMMYGKKRNAAGFWIVDSDDCCDNYQNKIGAL